MSAKKKPTKKTRSKSARPAILKPHRRMSETPEGIIGAAEKAYFAGSQSDLRPILSPLAESFEKLDTTSQAKYLALTALGSAHANQLIDAETAAVKLASLCPESPDPWFTLTFVHLSMREYTKAIEAGERYHYCVSNLSAEVSPVYCISGQHGSQVFNMMAVAAKDGGQIENAIEYYRKSIELDRGNHLPYLNLAAVLTGTGRGREADEIVKEGVRHARQVHELRMLQQASRPTATVSACMIVKNEEELLGDCLKSIRDWVDEIIVVDTGSTDRTVEIAQSYGAKVFHHPWEGDFSKARNQSLSYATGDWIFIIDADERIYADDVPALQKILKDNRVDVISINVYNVYGDGDTGVTFLPSTRFFRRKLGLRYEGIVHNVLVYPDTQPILRTGVRLRHLGYGLDKEKMRKKLERSRLLLEKQLAETPDSAFALFNYAQLLRGETVSTPGQNAELILKSARRAVELTNPELSTERHIHLMCLDQIGWTLFRQGVYDQAEETAHLALSYKPNYLDALLLLGHSAARKQQYEVARQRYLAYLKAQSDYDPVRETDNIIMLHVDSRTSAWYSLGMISELTGESDQAQRYYELIVEKDPAYLETNSHLGRLALTRNDLRMARHWYQRQVETHPESIDGYRQLGKVLLADNNPSKAYDIFRGGLDIAGSDVACLIGLGRAEGELGRTTQAADWLRKALQIEPENSTASRELASVLFKSGEYARAAEIYSGLTASNQADPDLLNDLGNCHFKMEQFESAEQTYRAALAHPDHIPSVWLNLGLTQLRLNQIDAACQSLGKYLEFHPDALDISNMLADIYFRSRRFSDALEYLERSLSARPDDTSALFQLSECYLHMGHHESAAIGYRRILALKPEFTPAEERLAQLTAPAPVQ